MKIAVASGKGGTGKTFVATHLFQTMKAMGEDVILADCDAEVPNAGLFLQQPVLSTENTEVFLPAIRKDLCTYCRRCAEVCSFNAICCLPESRYIQIFPELCHGCKACLYTCPEKAVLPRTKDAGRVSVHGRTEEKTLWEAKVSPGQKSPVPVIRHNLKAADRQSARWTVIDAPPGCSCPFVNSVIQADLVLLVTEPTLFGLNDLQLTLEVVKQLKKEYAVIINRSGMGKADFRKELEDGGIPVLAEIPYSEAIAYNYARGKLSLADKDIQQIFTELTRHILDHENSHCQR